MAVSPLGIHIRHPDTHRCIYCGVFIRETDRGKQCCDCGCPACHSGVKGAHHDNDCVHT